MPGGGGTIQNEAAPRGPSSPEEQAASRLAIQQANITGQAGKLTLIDPRVQLATFDTAGQAIKKRIADINAQLDNPRNWGVLEANTTSRWNLLQDQLAAETANLNEHEASRPLLEKQAARVESQEALNARVQARISDFLDKGLSVTPEDEKFIREKYEASIAGLKSQLPGLLQDTATTRGLNPTDVPVMQSVAGPLAGGIAGLQSEAASALLNQANANRALFTGVNQFQQGMDLSNRQVQLGLSAENPSANLTGIFSNLRGGMSGSNTSRTYGAGDYISMTGQGAAGIGLGAYGLSKAGLFGAGGGAGGMAVYGGTESFVPFTGGYLAAPAAGACWIAEAIYGANAPETSVIRWWLNTRFVKQPMGRVVMTLYSRYGRWIAQYARRWAWLRRILRPVFDVALRRGLAAG